MGHDLRGRYKDAPAPSIALYMPRRGLPILWRKGMPQANRNGGQKSRLSDDHDDHDDHDNHVNNDLDGNGNGDHNGNGNEDHHGGTSCGHSGWSAGDSEWTMAYSAAGTSHH